MAGPSAWLANWAAVLFALRTSSISCELLDLAPSIQGTSVECPVFWWHIKLHLPCSTYNANEGDQSRTKLTALGCFLSIKCSVDGSVNDFWFSMVSIIASHLTMNQSIANHCLLITFSPCSTTPFVLMKIYTRHSNYWLQICSRLFWIVLDCQKRHYRHEIIKIKLHEPLTSSCRKLDTICWCWQWKEKFKYNYNLHKTFTVKPTQPGQPNVY